MERESPTQLPDVARGVEEEREPADPGTELNRADSSDLWRETSDGRKDLLEESHDTTFPSGWGAFHSRISLFDSKGADGHRTTECYAGDNAENLELGVAEERE